MGRSNVIQFSKVEFLHDPARFLLFFLLIQLIQ